MATRRATSTTDNLPGEPVPLGDVIQAVADRVHYAEGRRTNFSVIGGVLIAGGLALLTFILDKQLPPVIWWPVMTGAIGSLITGAALFVAYSRQTNRYPWTSATETWKWFYRDALPRESAFALSWKSLFAFGKEKERLQQEYTNQLPDFEASIRRLSDKKVSMEQDVQQLYVLHINEKFKNLHLSQLRTLLQIGVLGTLLLVAVAAAIGFCVDSGRYAERRISAVDKGVHLDAAWRIVEQDNGGTTVLVNATYRNTTNQAASLPKWAVVTDQGYTAPVAETRSVEIAQIPARSSLRYSIVLRPQAPVRIQRVVPKLK